MTYDLDEAAENIDEYVQSRVSGRIGVSVLSVRAALKQSNDPVFCLAAWLKYNYGALYTGQENSNWMCDAEDIVKLVKGGKS